MTCCNKENLNDETKDKLPYILAYFGSEKGAPRSTSTYSAILDPQHYRMQPNNSQSQNKSVTSLPNKSLFNN